MTTRQVTRSRSQFRPHVQWFDTLVHGLLNRKMPKMSNASNAQSHFQRGGYSKWDDAGRKHSSDYQSPMV